MWGRVPRGSLRASWRTLSSRSLIRPPCRGESVARLRPRRLRSPCGGGSPLLAAAAPPSASLPQRPPRCSSAAQRPPQPFQGKRSHRPRRRQRACGQHRRGRAGRRRRSVARCAAIRPLTSAGSRHCRSARNAAQYLPPARRHRLLTLRLPNRLGEVAPWMRWAPSPAAPLHLGRASSLLPLQLQPQRPLRCEGRVRREVSRLRGRPVGPRGRRQERRQRQRLRR